MDFVTTHVVSAVGITLVHFLWQGAAIGLVTAAVLATCPRAMARTRYGIAGAGLAAMTMAPLVTLGLVWQTAPAMNAALPSFVTEADALATGGSLTLIPAALASWLPIAVAVWAIGVAALTVRLLVAWFRTERVRRHDVHPVSDGLAGAVRRLALDLGIRRPIALFESSRVDVPTVIGWIRPTILLPIGALTGLSVQQIEAVLSHELAHIKRHDYLVNVLQNFAETVFFYHPAVWWLSKQIRIEREHCCDDVAVEACGNPVLYARALTALEESRQHHAAFALAATDGSLLQRVRRLIGPARDDRREPSLPIAACVAVILAVLVFGGAQAQGSGSASVALVEGDVAEAARIETARHTDVRAAEDDRARYEQTQQGESGAGIERIDAETIQVDGDTYRRGTAEDLQRALRGARASAVVPQDGPTAAASDTQEETPKPLLRIGGDIKEPRKLHHVNPIYPDSAREAGVGGVVILETTIDPEGLPVGIKILRSIPALDQAAVNAVRQWRYEPTLLNGEPVAVIMTVTVNFSRQNAQTSQEQLETRATQLRRELETVTARLEAERRAAGGPSVSAVGAPLRIGGPISEPRKIRDVRPVYPKIAQASNVSGVVILEIVVNTDGDVTDVQILRSIPMLDSAAIEAVRQWRYTPTLLNGVPTPVQMTVTVNFTLH